MALKRQRPKQAGHPAVSGARTELQDHIRASNMTQSDKRDTQPSVQDVALIVGGGPGISSSCARLFAENGMRVAVAARNPDKAGP